VARYFFEQDSFQDFQDPFSERLEKNNQGATVIHSRALDRRSMGAGGITGCRDDARRQELFLRRAKKNLRHG
jgi:hypothetical protein